jgi:hypothetical protein
MASLFRRDPRSKLTSLFREVFADTAKANPEEPLYVAIAATARECGMQEFDAEALAERLVALVEKAKINAERAKPKGPRQQGSGFGAEYSKFIGALTTDELCLWLADYDVAKARILFCDTDIDDLSVMVDLKTRHEWQVIRTNFESCIIGFGGKLQGQSDATVHEVDMNDTGSVEDMFTAMRKLGL